jgi:DNA repair ATPase RecN
MGTHWKVAPDERRRMIAEAAYFRAERRGFKDGDAVRDWCEAEAEVDARLREAEDQQLREAVEEGLAAAKKALAALRRKAARLTGEARAEWQKDLDRLAQLRDSLRPKLAELKEQGEEARRRLREQADRLTAELAAAAERLARKRKQ